MDSVCIPLVEDTTHTSHQEVKVSSSSLREQKLAQLIRIPEVWLIASHKILIYQSYCCCVLGFGCETNHTMIGFVDLYKLVNSLAASLDTPVMSLRLC